MIKKYKVNIDDNFSVLVNNGPGSFSSLRTSLAVAKGIKMMVVDASTGKKADSNSKSTIIESFKEEKIANNNKIDIDNITDVSKTNILRFY